MFAMFHLGRPDVFPLGDLAVRKGLQELYKLQVVYSCLVAMFTLDVTSPQVSHQEETTVGIFCHQQMSLTMWHCTELLQQLVQGIASGSKA